MKKILVMFGNFTFHHFSPEEMLLFKNPELEQKALLHSVDKVCHCSSKAELDNLIDEHENSCEGWIVPSELIHKKWKTKIIINNSISSRFKS